MLQTTVSSDNIYKAKQDAILSIQDEKKRDLEIALWTIELIDEYKPEPSPPIPPIMKDYYAADAIKKKRLQGSLVFWQREDVRVYLEEKARAKNHNKADVDHLQWCLEALNPSDVKRKSIIEQKLLQYESRQKAELPPENIEWDD